MNQSFPDRLRILGYDYRVQHHDRIGMPAQDGTHNMGHAVIQLDTTNAPDHARQVLLHEVVHAVSDALSAELSEEQVHAVSRGLYAVCRDNPAFQSVLFPEPEPSLADRLQRALAQDKARLSADRKDKPG